MLTKRIAKYKILKVAVTVAQLIACAMLFVVIVSTMLTITTANSSTINISNGEQLKICSSGLLNKNNTSTVTNASSESVTVRCVLQLFGEHTKWIRTIKPHQTVAVPTSSKLNGFYVYDKNVKLIGFVKLGETVDY